MNEKFEKLMNIAGQNVNALDDIRKRLFMYKHATNGLSNTNKQKIEKYIETLKEKIQILKKANTEFKKDLEKQARDLRKYKLETKRKQNNFNLNNLLTMYEKSTIKKMKKPQNKSAEKELIKFLNNYNKMTK